MLSKLRVIFALIVGISTLFISMFMLGVEGTDAFKEKLYLLNSLLVPVIAISSHIKSKSDALTSIQGLRSKDMTRITAHSIEFNRRIWMLWFVYFVTFLCSVAVTLLPLPPVQIFGSVSFVISLFSVCFVASTSLYSTDQAIQILTIHLKAKAIKNAEREAALEQLKADDELPEDFQDYLKKQRGEV
ncbi:conserved membrane hypothetical protein [Vibrio nigripulchritudo SO65]|uniref:hypothetical protein n=1 Tax=Vibrio nigripulchritudo TaxID=28173 RepID=UPI0003B227F8|nr:hypothetical protein [Vibrio nigripulchritudo]CCN32785.1 conserved membrane hypothetical protein [Vibrio nigripulchritudo AM115]CCN43589.1 conserved membrane hypothetical protein [Vibrio nigripulchritudo FTn2]CCN63390.1 conserved membrane hypothetical protein [Vibrio nigripulchritudo POn4]CCN78718.1 conserved membrane hypothetical protein [Vibrio nigripulchritudo SO65]